MADINLRFHKDMLVLSSPIQAALQRQGIESAHDQALALLLEPETVEEAYRLESVAAPQCVVAPTANLTPLRLTMLEMEGKGPDLANNALQTVRAYKPQHILVEIGPCGLPLDASSKGSLNENRDQYARAAHLFDEHAIDAFFLNGFSSCADLKCALMGLRQASDAFVFASVDVCSDGMLANGRETLAEAVAVMAEYGASVAGFATEAAPDGAVSLAARAQKALESAGADLCLMAQLAVRKRDPKQFAPTPENPYCNADTMLPAAVNLRAAGVQFLRAVGDATPAYTGVLAAATTGQDVAAR